MNMSFVAPALCLALLASGCATFDDDDYGYKGGWRRGRVVKVGGMDAPMQVSQTDCRTELGPNSPYSQFAIVSYNVGGSPKLKGKRISAIPEGLALQAGDLVYVNLRDCQTPLRKREAVVKNP